MTNKTKKASLIRSSAIAFRSVTPSNLMLTLGLLVAVSLSACGGSKVISTQDESADYKSARALPPLRKPADTPVEQAQPQVVSAPPVASRVAVSDADASQQSVDETSASTSVVEDSAATTALASDSDLAVDTVSMPGSVPFKAQIVNEDGKARLVVDSEFDQAWASLTDELINSELTVFSRNKTAGRISIGCAEIGNDTDEEVKNVGGWSIFSRRKGRASEYCALQASAKKDTTVVSVLDRRGEEVTAELGELILNRIVN